MDADCVVILTTMPSEGDGEGLAVTLVEERLAACVNLLPVMRSIYRWEGRVERESERQVLIKTTAPRVAALRQRLGELHPYDVPEFVVLSVADGSDAYLGWVRDATRS